MSMSPNLARGVLFLAAFVAAAQAPAAAFADVTVTGAPIGPADPAPGVLSVPGHVVAYAVYSPS